MARRPRKRSADQPRRRRGTVAKVILSAPAEVPPEAREVLVQLLADLLVADYQCREAARSAGRLIRLLGSSPLWFAAPRRPRGSSSSLERRL